MRPIAQEEAQRMRSALKEFASYYNPAAKQDGAQPAARLAREALEQIGLFFEKDANPPEPAS